MRRQFRITLPVVMGTISLPLVLWDIYNQRVIMAMGMGWDTGAPVWPYQTPDFLLRLLNAPAYLIVVPIANTLKLFGPGFYLLVFPAILVWWWFLGLRLDRGLVITKSRWRWPVFSLLVAFAVLLVWAAASICADSFRWWSQYVDATNLRALLIMTRLLIPAAWSVIIALLSLAAARRVAAAR
jgi:hypothetical protein